MKERLDYCVKMKTHSKIGILVALFFFVSVLSSQSGMMAQNVTPITITGTVTDKFGEPLPGVSVSVKGTTKAVQTDNGGKYSITASNNKTVLSITYIGFLEQTVTVGSKRVINIELLEKETLLDEVIVIGYGVQKKRDISGAIESISAKAIEEKSPINIFEALQGEMAGVEVTTGSGAPGEGAEIRIRGVSTFGEGSKPLFVVDGVPTDDISMISPSDIASIEVLKDAASAAIYGSRSANGVVLVSTKKGDKTNPKLDIRYQKSFSNLIRKMPATNGVERRHYDTERRRFNPAAGLLPTDTMAFYNNNSIDLQDLLFRTAEKDEIGVSISGGANTFNYYMGLTYLSEKGIIENSNFDRITARLRVGYKVNNMISTNTNVELSYSDKKGIDEANVLNQLLERVPYWAIYTPDGEFTPNILSRRNPLAVAMTDVNKAQAYRASLYQDVKLQLHKKILATASIQATYSNGRSQSFRPSPQLSSTEVTTGRDYSTVRYNWANENYVSYNDTFGEHHKFDAMVGMSVYEWISEVIRVTGQKYASDEIYTLNAASVFDKTNTYTTKAENAMMSYFARVGYNYKSKYLVNATLRYDGSSRLGSNQKWGAFPSASAAWRWSDEEFIKWAKPFVEDGKLRFSWGKTGNQEIGNYESLQLYTPSAIYDEQTGIYASNLSYPMLSWETTTQYNIGLDLNMMKGKVNVVTDIYWKDTDNLLAKVELPKESGFSDMRQNIGAMTNRGIEISVRYNILKKKNFNWSANFNIATQKTLITRLASGTPFYKGTDDVLYIEEGGRLGNLNGYKYLGIFAYDQSNAFTDNGTRLTPVFDNGVFQNYLLDGQAYNGTVNQKKGSDGKVLGGGDIDFYDQDGNYMITPSDRTSIGNAQADFFGGFGTNITYRRLNLAIGFAYSFGGDVYNKAESKRNAFAYDGATPSPDAIRTMWLYPGDDAQFPRPQFSSHNSLAASSFFIEDASYIKLKNVRLTYTFSNKLLKHVLMKSAAMYVYGNNLLTFTDYKGYDPEFSTSGDALTMGVDNNRYPRKREFGFGLNVSF